MSTSFPIPPVVRAYDHPLRVASAGIARRECRRLAKSLARAREHADRRAVIYLTARLERAAAAHSRHSNFAEREAYFANL